MPKIKIPEKPIYVPPPLSEAQLIVLEKEINEAGGKQKWLVKQGAIRLKEYGNFDVVARLTGKFYNEDGVLKDGYDIPYDSLSEKIKQLENWQDRRENRIYHKRPTFNLG